MMMNSGSPKPALLDLRLAALLSYGTWVASAIIAAGLALPVFALPSVIGHVPVVTVGIVVIILLPVMRVLMMCLSFLHARDFIFSAIAAWVLTIIIFSFAIGTTAG